MKKAFTLAEVMIVLTVIGVLTAILLPVARQSMPDENLMKFKKAHNTLGTVIRELVTSDKYYLDGDLGVKPNGDLIDGKLREEDRTYLCHSIADILNAKNVKCSTYQTPEVYYTMSKLYSSSGNLPADATMDNWCTYYPQERDYKIELNDGVIFYEQNPYATFGIQKVWVHGYSAENTTRIFKDYKDENGFEPLYKILCIDIDGIPNTASSNNCINECPFAYAVRYDGKIVAGKRALEWLERDVNKE